MAGQGEGGELSSDECWHWLQLAIEEGLQGDAVAAMIDRLCGGPVSLEPSNKTAWD